MYRNNAERHAAYRQWKRKRQSVLLPHKVGGVGDDDGHGQNDLNGDRGWVGCHERHPAPPMGELITSLGRPYNYIQEEESGSWTRKEQSRRARLAEVG